MKSMTSAIPAMSRMTHGRPPCGAGEVLLLLARAGLNLAINAMVSPRCGGHAKIEKSATKDWKEPVCGS